MVGIYFQIDDWILSVDENKLYRQDREVSVEPRLVNLLHFLAEHAGEVFCREELIEHVWDGAIVTDQVVTQSIFELRKLLKDGREEQTHYVVTVPKRGYKLVAQVESVPSEEFHHHATPHHAIHSSPNHHHAELQNGGRQQDSHDVEAESESEQAMAFPAAPLTRAVCQNKIAQANQPSSKLNKRFKHNCLNALWVSLLIAAVAVFTYQQSNVRITQVIDSHLVEFKFVDEFNQDTQSVELADGIVQKLMSDITQVTPYRVKLDRVKFTSGNLPGKTITVRVANESGNQFLEVEYINNTSEKVLFSRQYPLSQPHLKAVLRQVSIDLMTALKVPDAEKKSQLLIAGLPNSSEALKLLIEANHYLNVSELDKFQHGVALLEETLKIEPQNNYVQAELLIAYYAQKSLEPTFQIDYSRMSNLIEELNESLVDAVEPVQPRIYEALALYEMLNNNLDKAHRHLTQAMEMRDSAMAYVLLGKYSELTGDLDRASEAYSEAFYIDTSMETYMLCENLLFYTNLKSLDHSLYRSVHPSVVHLL
ncbi:transcriptional regulator CadC [Vibrio ponticus]|uniref:Transcriptional regulator CadC n=1 Tax=Vibrio ponticus TaxID=265668 RepID=A0ABX3FEI8_9VIBR|nr:lysine decarboxylation/transport transcriptional activator CadC [Vibrio ponticus]OLQ91052.1 transcriptional regulator CadC [Vibrio ponticus]